MTSAPARDLTHDLAELRCIAHRLGVPGMTRAEGEARLRVHADALTFMARLRRGGMSDAAVAAALFDASDTDA